jgi:hypothetical protein
MTKPAFLLFLQPLSRVVLITFLVPAVAADTSATAVAGSLPPALDGSTWQAIPELSDEFDGSHFVRCFRSRSVDQACGTERLATMLARDRFRSSLDQGAQNHPRLRLDRQRRSTLHGAAKILVAGTMPTPAQRPSEKPAADRPRQAERSVAHFHGPLRSRKNRVPAGVGIVIERIMPSSAMGSTASNQWAGPMSGLC